MSDYALRLVRPDERADYIVTRAVQQARETHGPVAHLRARAFVYALGGNGEMARTAEQLVLLETAR